MAIRHIDFLEHLPTAKLFASPSIAVLSLATREPGHAPGRPAEPYRAFGRGFGLSRMVRLEAPPIENGSGQLGAQDAREIFGFLQEAAQRDDISMLVVHSEERGSVPAAVAWLASFVYQAKFVTRRRIDVDAANEPTLERLEAAAHVQVGRPGNIVVKTGFIAA